MKKEPVKIPTPYPLTEPPEQIAGRKSKEWSTREAEDCFAWFLANEGMRVQHFLAFFKQVLPDDCREVEEFLLNLGQEYVERLRAIHFSTPDANGRLQLTNQGIALASDAGLFVAHLLIKHSRSRAHWELLNDPGAFSHNRPVLTGFVHQLYLDPVGAIYEARAVLNGKKSSRILKDAFVFWKDRLA